MKKYLMPIVPILVYFFLQVFFAVLIIGIYMVANWNEMSAFFKNVKYGDGVLPSDMMPQVCLSLIFSGLFTVVLCYLLKFANAKHATNFAAVNWRFALIGLCGFVFIVFATDVAVEMFDLPDEMGEIFAMMSGSVVGALSIAVFGPIAEEYVFRECCIGYMVRHGVKPWVAIISSAVVFGLVHGNPVQIPFAMVVGVVLGMVYYKTGNIVVSSMLHIINNSVSVIMYAHYGSEAEEMTMESLFGGSTALVIALAVVAAGVGVGIMCYYWKKHPDTNVESFKQRCLCVD